MRLTKLKSFNSVNIVVKNNIDWERKVSKPQKLIKDFLFPYWEKDKVTEEFVIPGSILRIDLFNLSKKIAVEVSPDEYHVNFNSWLHKNRSNFLNKIKNDQEKRNWCEKNKIKLIELYSEDIKNLSYQYILEKYKIEL